MDVPKVQFSPRGIVTSAISASQFIADIRGKTIPPDQILRRCLTFQSIPPDLARDVLRKRLEEMYDETTGPLKIQHLMQLFAFCQRTFFTFDGRTYEQIKGTPMGSPISSLVAELVLQELEKVAFSHYKPAFWRRYADDTFVIIEKDKLPGFQDLLNSIFPDIQFTREDEEDEKLPFLDVLVTRTPDGKLSTTVYRKATNTTRVLNYHSKYPLVHKRSCIGLTKLVAAIAYLQKQTTSSSSQSQPKPSKHRVQFAHSARSKTVATCCYPTNFDAENRRCISSCFFTSRQRERTKTGQPGG
ncbi:hypothetical protein SprV_0200857000 [Sparganum proliferum]